MNQKELVTSMALSAGVSEKVAVTVLKAFTAAVAKSMARGNSVYVADFGVFKLGRVKARIGINPKTRAPISIPAKKVLRLQVAPAFKDRLN